jgi:hypothetical protein
MSYDLEFKASALKEWCKLDGAKAQRKTRTINRDEWDAGDDFNPKKLYVFLRVFAVCVRRVFPILPLNRFKALIPFIPFIPVNRL